MLQNAQCASVSFRSRLIGYPYLDPMLGSHTRGGGGLIETGGLIGEGDLFSLEMTMVSVLHKELEYKVEMLK